FELLEVLLDEALEPAALLFEAGGERGGLLLASGQLLLPAAGGGGERLHLRPQRLGLLAALLGLGAEGVEGVGGAEEGGLAVGEGAGAGGELDLPVVEPLAGALALRLRLGRLLFEPLAVAPQLLAGALDLGALVGRPAPERLGRGQRRVEPPLRRAEAHAVAQEEPHAQAEEAAGGQEGEEQGVHGWMGRGDGGGYARKGVPRGPARRARPPRKTPRRPEPPGRFGAEARSRAPACGGVQRTLARTRWERPGPSRLPRSGAGHRGPTGVGVWPGSQVRRPAPAGSGVRVASRGRKPVKRRGGSPGAAAAHARNIGRSGRGVPLRTR